VTAGITLAVLGVPDVRLAGAPVVLPAKSLALVVYLAISGKRARRDLLADMFWGETGDDGARANLRLALTKLRQSLPGLIHADADSVGLSPDAALDVDALQLQHTVDTLLQQPVAAHEAAIARYRGVFMQDFTLRDCAGFEDWVTAERQRIDRRAVVLLRELVQAARRLGKVDREIHHLGLWAQIEPWNEEAQLPLIRLLAQAGSTAAALDRFESCRRALAEELGARPSVALALLAEQVRRGEVGPVQAPPLDGVALAPAPDVAAATPAAPAQDAAPPPGTPLYGRDADLRHIRDRVAQGERLVVLLGPAGVGKSSLARALAQDLAGTYPDGQVACSFDFMDEEIDEQASQDHFVGVVGSALGLDLTLTAQPLALLKSHLADRRILLGLDGFEACVKAAPAVLDVAQAAPQCLLLVTSRTRLATTHGWTYELEGLTAPPQAHHRDPGVELLLACARRAGVVLDDRQDHDLLSRLVRLLDGSPLAIQFAAQSLRVLQPRELVHRLEKGDWPDSSLHMPGYRYSTLQDVMDDTWAQLAPGLREAWARCALFKGSFALDWAHDCAGTNDNQIMLLVERSILSRDAPGRLFMHAMARQYGLMMLDTLPDAGDHRQVFAHAALARLVAACAQLNRGPQAAAVLETLHREIATVASAFEMALHWASPDEIQPPLLALQNVYHRLGWHHAANRLMESVLARHPQASPAWRMIWHHMASEVVHSQHGYFRNNDHCAAAVALAGIALPRGTVRAWLATLSNMAQALLARPARDPVQRLAQRSLAHSLHSLLTQRFVNGASVAELMGYLTASALAAQRSGMADARLAFMTRLLSLEPVRRRPRLNSLLLRRIRAQLKDVDPVREAAVDRALGHAMISAGRWDEVEAHFRRAAATLAALGYGYDAQECQMQISTMWLHRGAFVQLGEAVAVAEQGARRTEQPAILRFALLFKLQLWLRTGTSTLDAAMACLQMIHAIPARRIQLEEIRLLANEALLLAARSDDDGVLQRAQEILDLSRNMQGGARIYPLAPLAVIIDAVLHVAGRRSAGDDLALVLARALTRRYLKLAGGMQIFDARCCLYQGAMAALEGRCSEAVHQWHKGLDSCAPEDLLYDRARLHWLLSLHAPEAERARHEAAAAGHFARCGVAGPPYPLLPLQGLGAAPVRQMRPISNSISSTTTTSPSPPVGP
jgi:DNA-binding SARP family transcriptional activator/energy-coupling factor transporter ATP-binding protein EcfA2